MQKLIGLSLAIFANFIAWSLSNDWRIAALGIIIGVGGVVYGDSE